MAIRVGLFSVAGLEIGNLGHLERNGRALELALPKLA